MVDRAVKAVSVGCLVRPGNRGVVLSRAGVVSSGISSFAWISARIPPHCPALFISIDSHKGGVAKIEQKDMCTCAHICMPCLPHMRSPPTFA